MTCPKMGTALLRLRKSARRNIPTPLQFGNLVHIQLVRLAALNQAFAYTDAEVDSEMAEVQRIRCETCFRNGGLCAQARKPFRLTPPA